MKQLIFLSFIVPFSSGYTQPHTGDPIYNDKNAPVEYWAKDLVGRMTSVEKNLQLNQSTYGININVNNIGEEIKFDLRATWDTIRVLENPHKGWYHHYYDNGHLKYKGNSADIEAMPGLDILFIRLAWSYFEPTEGNYDWHYIDDLVNEYGSKGFRFGFAFSCKETNSQATPAPVGYATPKWVFDLGAKGKLVNCWGTMVMEPDYGDAIFLEKLNNFHMAVALRYQNKPWLAFVQMASYGSWGEGHNWPSSDTVYDNSVIKKHIDIYKQAYTNRKINICISDDVYNKSANKSDIRDYAETNELFWTDHSVNVESYVDRLPATFSVAAPELFLNTYKNRPTQIELEHYGKTLKVGKWSIPEGTQNGAALVRGAVNLTHPTWLGFHGDIKSYYADNPEFCKEMANKVGYWYFVDYVAISTKAISGTNQNITIKWSNKGVAPAYHQYQLKFKFTNSNTAGYFTIANSNNIAIQNDSVLIETYNIQVPSNLKAGVNEIKIKLTDDLDTKRDVELGLSSIIKDSEGYYKIGTIIIDNSVKN